MMKCEKISFSKLFHTCLITGALIHLFTIEAWSGRKDLILNVSRSTFAKKPTLLGTTARYPQLCEIPAPGCYPNLVFSNSENSIFSTYQTEGETGFQPRFALAPSHSIPTLPLHSSSPTIDVTLQSEMNRVMREAFKRIYEFSVVLDKTPQCTEDTKSLADSSKLPEDPISQLKFNFDNWEIQVAWEELEPELREALIAYKEAHRLDGRSDKVLEQEFIEKIKETFTSCKVNFDQLESDPEGLFLD